MTPFRYTLVADGPSDRCLLPIIDSVVNEIKSIAAMGVIRQFASQRVTSGLSDRIRRAVIDFPADLIFVHRDAERDPMDLRVSEIAVAVKNIRGPALVPVVPVRMTEAWFLIEEAAIRRAADNPNGSVKIRLPKLSEIESLPDPKERLFELLVTASEKRGRRLDQFRTVASLSERRVRVANLIGDFVPLRGLGAFKAFRENAHVSLMQWLAGRNTNLAIDPA